MTQEQKDLLLRDLCGRLPYGVKVQYQVGSQLPDIKTFNAKQYDELSKGSYIDDWLKCTFKPYLFPLWGMTEEQKKEFPFESSLLNAFINGYISLFEDEELAIDDVVKMFEQLNKNHFDYRGLIPKDLAIDATGLNIY